MLLQLKCQYLQRTVPGVGSLMGPIEDSLIEAFLPALFGGEEVSANLREILGHSVKHRGRSIPDPWLLAKCAYSTSKVASEILVGFLLGCTNPNYVAHNGFIRRASADGRKQWELAEKAVILRRK